MVCTTSSPAHFDSCLCITSLCSKMLVSNLAFVLAYLCGASSMRVLLCMDATVVDAVVVHMSNQRTARCRTSLSISGVCLLSWRISTTVRLIPVILQSDDIVMSSCSGIRSARSTLVYVDLSPSEKLVYLPHSYHVPTAPHQHDSHTGGDADEGTAASDNPCAR